MILLMMVNTHWRMRYGMDVNFVVVLSDAASVLRQDKHKFARNVDSALRGRSVGGVSFDRNKTYKGQ